MTLRLQAHITPGARADMLSNQGFLLEIPAGGAGAYRQAQLDDYNALPRSAFLWRPPFLMDLEARASAASIPGTWGFGLWNNPFSIRTGLDWRGLFPALPDAAWFFSASRENHLSFRDDLPAQGFIAQTFRASRRPLWLLSPAAAFLPIFWLRPAARLFRRWLSRSWISEDGVALTNIDPISWHHYRMIWEENEVQFSIDGEPVLHTGTSPAGPLGVVIWVDNQFAAFTPAGRIAFGTLPNQSPAWLEIRALRLEQG